MLIKANVVFLIIDSKLSELPMNLYKINENHNSRSKSIIQNQKIKKDRPNTSVLITRLYDSAIKKKEENKEKYKQEKLINDQKELINATFKPCINPFSKTVSLIRLKGQK